MTQNLLVALFGLLLLPGLAMVFIPLFPAFWYLISVALVFGIVDGFIIRPPNTTRLAAMMKAEHG